jgi:hypothetical protein
MSQFVRMKSDPRADKGICSDCKFLSVRETETGSSTVLCRALSSEDSVEVIPIRHKIITCTDHKPQPRGNFILDDGWTIDIDSITGEPCIRKGQRRFYQGQFEQQHYQKGRYVWKPVQKGDEE